MDAGAWYQDTDEICLEGVLQFEHWDGLKADELQKKDRLFLDIFRWISGHTLRGLGGLPEYKQTKPTERR